MATKTGRFEMRVDPVKLAVWRDAAQIAALSLPAWLEKAADLYLASNGSQPSQPAAPAAKE